MASAFIAKLMSLEKVVNHLSSANSQPEIPAEFWIPTMITYFKLSFELSWKVMKKHMQDRSIDSASTGSPRETSLNSRIKNIILITNSYGLTCLRIRI